MNGPAPLAERGNEWPYAQANRGLTRWTDAADGDRSGQRGGWPARGRGEDSAPRWRVLRDGAEDPDRRDEEPAWAAPRGGGRDAGGSAR